MNTEARDSVLNEVGPLQPAVKDLGDAFTEICIVRDLSHREAMSTVAILLGTLVSIDDDQAERERHFVMMDLLIRVMVGKILETDPPP